jgi:NTE family protein
VVQTPDAGRYSPLPPSERSGVALCLSGGGYRAVLFHLGAMRRLNELGILSRVDTITSVSGGSIAAAQVATHLLELGGWPAAGQPVPGWEEEVARPLRAFTRTDSRTGPLLRRAHPRSWLNQNASAEALAARYAAGPARGRLGDLPERPRFVFLATDLLFRAQWAFDTGRKLMGDERAGFAPLSGRWTLARAVAASSCLPGAFRPLAIGDDAAALAGGSYAGADRDELLGRIELGDGGLYDILGLEPVWRDHAVVLVSDAAPSFHARPRLGALWRLLRIVVTLLEQATDVRKRWLISEFAAGVLEGAYWGIGSKPASYAFDGGAYDPPLSAYGERLIEDLVSQIRIDFDPFSDAEIGVLENHGYLMAEIAVRRHAPRLAAAGAPPPDVPHPEWMDERRLGRALADSYRTRMFARRFGGASAGGPP